MADFETAVTITLKHEGGFFHNPRTGEVVNRGITHWLLRDLGILPKAPRNQVASQYEIDFVRGMTLDQTKAIYKQEFWDKEHLGELESQEIACKVFDIAVNVGCPEAVTLLQRAINDIRAGGVLKSVKVDGVLGPQTIAAVNASDPVKLLGKRSAPGSGGLRFETELFYLTLVQAQPWHTGDLRGWLVRLDS